MAGGARESGPLPAGGTAGWYCVQTLAHKEALALQHLQRQAFDAFLPRIQKARRHARRYDTVLAPLFPCYLFVQMDPARERWRSINGTLGVARLIMAGDAPLKVPCGVVEAIQAASDDGGRLQAERLEMLQKDDPVRILVGPFADRIATVARLDARGRVQLLLELLGGSVRVTLPRTAVLKSA